MIRLLKIVAALMIVAPLAHADGTAASGSTVTPYVIEGVSSKTGKLRLDPKNNYSVLGATAPAKVGGANVVLTTSGTVVMQSTTTTAAQPILDLRNNAGTSVGKINQDGSMSLPGTLTVGTLSAGAGVVTVNSTGTWTAPQTYLETVTVSTAMYINNVVNISSDAIFSGLMSTFTLVNPGTILQTKFFVAQATVTATVNGTHDLFFNFNCVVGVGATAGSYGWTILVDGAYPNYNGMAVQKGASSCLGYGAAGQTNCSYPFILPRGIVRAGSHTFAVSLADGANNTITYPAAAYQSMTWPCQWQVRELP